MFYLLVAKLPAKKALAFVRVLDKIMTLNPQANKIRDIVTEEQLGAMFDAHLAGGATN